MRESSILKICCLTVPLLFSCKKQLEEPLGSHDPSRESPVGQTTTQRGPTPLPRNNNEAPLHNVNDPTQKSPELAAADADKAANVPGTGAQATGREAKAELRALTGDKLRGRASLKERSNGVEIALEVKNGAPGTRLVGLRDTGSCSEAEPKNAPPAATTAPGAHAAQDINPELGALVINDNGEGTLRINVPSANLQQEQQGSLLGKALVIYPEERINTDRDKGKNVIACAQILAN